MLKFVIRFSSRKWEHTDAHSQYFYHISVLFSIGTGRKLNFQTYFVESVRKYVFETCVCTSVTFAEIIQNSCAVD